MIYSEFGIELKKILIEKNMRIYDLAKKLDVSSAFVSSVITGKRNVPKDWVKQLKAILSLTDEQENVLSEKAYKSQDVFKIDVTNYNQMQKNTLYAFQRSLEDLDEETLKKLNEILEKRGDK